MRVWNSRGELSGWRGREWRMHSFDDINSIQFRANVGRQRSSSSFFSTTTADSEQVSLDALLSTLTLLLVSSIPEPCQRSTFSSMIPVLFTFTSLMVSLMDSSQRIDFDWSPFPLRLSPSKPTDKSARNIPERDTTGVRLRLLNQRGELPSRCVHRKLGNRLREV